MTEKCKWYEEYVKSIKLESELNRMRYEIIKKAFDPDVNLEDIEPDK